MILVVPESHGPSDPRPPAPAPAPGSVRRTSSFDTFRTGDLLGPSVTEARARDLVVDADGTRRVHAEATVTVELDGFAHNVAAIVAEPPLGGLDALVGHVIGAGFRKRLDGAVGLGGSGDLRYFLLDDLPGAILVSGYALLHADVVDGIPPEAPEHAVEEYLNLRADLCAGWARDGTMLRLIGEHHRSPVPLGPPAPPVTAPDDPGAFHPLADLPTQAMRRIRRVDVGGAQGDVHAVDAFFRDTHHDVGGPETIVHEYSVELAVDAATRTVVEVVARPDVLPWVECPSALVSAQRLVGVPVADLQTFVRRELTGVSTCTHLNDVLRCLADVEHLLDLLPGTD